MRYIFDKDIQKWRTDLYIITDKNFTKEDLKKMLKIKNRTPGINHGKGYEYIDLSDIKLILNDGVLYGKYDGCSFHIWPNEVVNKSILKNIVQDYSVIIDYVKENIETRSDWLNLNVDLNDLSSKEKAIEQNVKDTFTEEQLLYYDLNK